MLSVISRILVVIKTFNFASYSISILTGIKEENVLSNKFVINQKMVLLNFPENSYIINNNGQVAVYNSGTGQVVPVIFMGQPTSIDGKIYDKQESILWE